MITVTNLKKRYNSHDVLKGLNLKVEKGDIYGFLGNNGAGKSTTLNILTNLIKYNSGDIDICPSLGYLPENPVFYDYMTAKEYLKFIGELQSNASSKRCDEVLELVGLRDKKRIKTYSRGMKQRLGLASALYHDPTLLLLDEPSSALDPAGRKQMLELIKHLKNEGKTIFFSSHILDDVEKVSNKIGLLNNGIMEIEMNISELKAIESNTYIIEANGLSDQLLSSIDAIEYNHLTEFGVEITTDRDDILKVLANLPLTISSFYKKKQTLEDVFMRMVTHDN